MNEKKSLLFVCYGLGVGGIERCMINLLNAMDMDKYSIDILPLNPIYDLVDSLKVKCKILDPFEFAMNTTDTYKELKERKARPNDYLRYALFRLLNKWGNKPWLLFKAPKKHYDIAIAYAHIPFVPYYVIDCISAKFKYMWHHNGRYSGGKYYRLDKKYYSQFDAIISVSEDNRRELIRAFPSIKDRITVIHTVIDVEEIKQKALAPIDEECFQSEIMIVTVGRLSSAKKPEYMVQVAKMLKEEHLDFCWYWIGGGELENQIRVLIQDNDLTNHIKLTGNIDNPYSYIYNCDIYVQPSEYEAFCTATREAQILEKPIIVTDVGGMREQFNPGEDCIMTNIDVNEIFKAVLFLARHPEERQRLRDSLHIKKMNEDNNLQQHYKLFDYGIK